MTLLILALTCLALVVFLSEVFLLRVAFLKGEHHGWTRGFREGVELERRLHAEARAARAARAPASSPVSSEPDLLLSDFLIFDTPRLRH